MARAKERDYGDPMTLELAGNDMEAGSIAVEQKILAEFNQADRADTWSVNVTRFIKYGQPEERCFEADVGDIQGVPDRIASDWGPGMYIVRVRRNGELKHAFRYAIGAPKVSPASQVKSEMESFVRLMGEQMKETRAMFERFMSREQQGGNKGSSVTELVTALGALDTIRNRGGNSQGGGDNVDRTIELIRLGIEIAGKGGSAEPAGWGDILVKLASSPLAQRIGELAQSGQLTPPALARPAIAATTTRPGVVEGPTVVRQPNAADATQPPSADEIQKFMFAQIAYLLGRAHMWKQSQMRQASPDLYAEWVCDNIPVELLLPIVNAQDPMGALAAFVPEVGAHADWFMALVAATREELTDMGVLGEGAGLANGASNGNGGAHVPDKTPTGPSANP